MTSVRTKSEVDSAAKNAIQSLYGKDIEDFKVRVLLSFPNENQREAWDANVTFMSKGLQYTVDLLINENDGQVTNARLIDTLKPL